MFKVANIETAMCLWEAVQDLLNASNSPVLHPLAVRLVDEAGTPAARHVVIGWIDECEREWEAARAAGTESPPYDWEHCPAFLARKLQERFPDVAPPHSIPAAPDGPYSPGLAEAFRQGARELCNCELGDRIHIDASARVEECEAGDGGAIVHCTIYVSDSERQALAGEEA